MTAQRSDPWTRLESLWPLLAITRIPGTRRPWRPAELTGQQREERDAQLRAERLADTATYAPGLRWLARPGVIFASPHAPLHVDVLDTLAALHRQLATAATDLSVWPQVLMLSSLSDPRPLLAACRDAARSKPDGIPVDSAAWEMLHTIERALAEIWDGQKLAAECPWCHGGLAVDRQTWRVRVLPPDMPAIVCESGTCQPPDSDVGTWWRDRPAWPLWEWSWLAQRLESDEQAHARRRDEIQRELSGRKQAL